MYNMRIVSLSFTQGITKDYPRDSLSVILKKPVYIWVFWAWKYLQSSIYLDETLLLITNRYFKLMILVLLKNNFFFWWILAWRIPWTEEPGRLQSIGSKRVRQDWGDSARMHTHSWFTMSCSFHVHRKVNHLYIHLLFFRFFSHTENYRVLSGVPYTIQHVLTSYLFYT